LRNEWERLHQDFGAMTIGFFIGSLITANFILSLLGLVTLLICGYFGSKIKGITKKGREILRKYCLPLSAASLSLWVLHTLTLYFNPALRWGPGILALACLCLVQYWSGPKVVRAK
jgi:hypothetical protein